MNAGTAKGKTGSHSKSDAANDGTKNLRRQDLTGIACSPRGSVAYSFLLFMDWLKQKVRTIHRKYSRQTQDECRGADSSLKKRAYQLNGRSCAADYAR